MLLVSKLANCEGGCYGWSAWKYISVGFDAPANVPEYVNELLPEVVVPEARTAPVAGLTHLYVPAGTVKVMVGLVTAFDTPVEELPVALTSTARTCVEEPSAA